MNSRNPVPISPSNGKGRDDRSDRVQRCADGKYRWIYELNMLTNPAIILVVFKIYGAIFAVIILLMFIGALCNGTLVNFLGDFKIMLIFLLVFSAVIVVAYLIVAARNGGKYIVFFEMDDEGVLHRQLSEQVKKAKALGWLIAMVGAAAGSATTAGSGLLAATKTSSYSSFSHVRSVKAYRWMHLIKVNEPFSKNQVYVTDEDFDFVLDFIRQRCPRL